MANARFICTCFPMKWVAGLGFIFVTYAWSSLTQKELRPVQEIYLLQKLLRASLIAHCCSSHQNRKMCLLLIWWQAPYVPYEKGVNKMHVGNIKQGQGRQFGWWPFFKCGKQKNKMVLAVAAVGTSGFGWGAWGMAAEGLATCFRCPVRNTVLSLTHILSTVGAPSFAKLQ